MVAPHDLLDGVHEPRPQHGEAVLHPAPRAGQVDHEAPSGDAGHAAGQDGGRYALRDAVEAARNHGPASLLGPFMEAGIKGAHIMRLTSPGVDDTAGVLVAGHRYPVAGRVCMDQLVIDVGPVSEPGGDGLAAGERVVLFGPGDDGEPTAQDWADAVGTISYEIVSRLGTRLPREHVG